jgi:hypothetical protein
MSLQRIYFENSIELSVALMGFSSWSAKAAVCECEHERECASEHYISIFPFLNISQLSSSTAGFDTSADFSGADCGCELLLDVHIMLTCL